jgi:tRNA pseudouridine55 synthase
MTVDVLDALSQEDRKNSLLPVDRLLSTLLSVVLSHTLASRFMQGQRLALGKEGVYYPPGGIERVKVVDATQVLLGVASVSPDGMLQPERLISMKERHKPVFP